MSFLRSLIFAAIIVIAIVHFGGNYLAAQSFENWLGSPVSVSNVRWGISNHRLVMKGVKVKNPQGYGTAPLAVIEKIQADYDLTEIRKGLLKINYLEVTVGSIHLEKKSPTEINAFELNPLRAIFGKAPAAQNRHLPARVEIEKVHIQLNKVLFETKLGNDTVNESRVIESPKEDLTVLKTPDSVAVYIVLLALRGAGWQNLLPARAEIIGTVENEVNSWVEDLRHNVEVAWVQLQQLIAEKLNPKT